MMSRVGQETRAMEDGLKLLRRELNQPTKSVVKNGYYKCKELVFLEKTEIT